MKIVPTAIAQPQPPQPQIVRASLAQKTDAVDTSRVTTIFAPAGYGKTNAAKQWATDLARRGRKILWLAARAGISSFEEFIEAIKAAAKEQGMDWETLPKDTPPARAFAHLVAAQKFRPVLVIDDAQILNGEIFEFVTQTIASARDSLTTIIVSRSLDVLPVARLRSLGHLFEVDARDLRFSVAETSEVLAGGGHRRIDVVDLQQLVEDTCGWPAGIAMARNIQRKHWREADEAMIRPSGLRREFESYFDEEVISLEPSRIRNFLVATIILDDLTPPACAAVTGTDDARRMLEEVESRGLFLSAVDQDRSCYRYHPLFREMVLRRLNDRDPARASELQKLASRHFASTGDVARAIEHAERSGDCAFLADQLDLLAEPLIYTGLLTRVDNLAAGFPSTILASRPRLTLALAWRRVRSLAFESAEALIALATEEIDRRRASGGDPLDLRHLDMAVEHRRLMLAAARDDLVNLEAPAETLLRQLGDNQPYLSCTLLALLMSSRRELYHFQDILRLEAEARRALGRPGADFASIALKASIAPTLAVQGKVEAAEKMLRDALDYALSNGNVSIAAIPALPLAELLYDQGKLEEARALVEAYLPVARQWGLVDQLSSGHLVKARLIYNEGDLFGAIKVLDEMQLVAIECGLDRLRAHAVGEQVRMLSQNGHHEQARGVLEASGLMPAGEPYPTLNPTRQYECMAIACIRIEMQEHRLSYARKIAKRWHEFVRRHGAVRSTVVFELLLAEIAVLAGDRSEARRVMREAVATAATVGWTRIFLDEGEAIRTLLTEAYTNGPALEALTDQFGARLVQTFKGTQDIDSDEDCGLAGKLITREIDILRMVGGGLRNREIGCRLGLTEGTVKWYMQQIYDKLGVRRRPQAVSRARQLGLLA